MKLLPGCLLLAFLCDCSPDKQNGISTWPTFGHDVSNNKFSGLTDIDTSNVRQLKEVWRYEDIDEGGGFIEFEGVEHSRHLIPL